MRSLVRVVGRPVGLLADVDAVERRHGDEDPAAADELGQVPVEEREQQRRDVVAVGVGVGEQDDALVAQACEVEARADRRSRAP